MRRDYDRLCLRPASANFETGLVGRRLVPRRVIRRAARLNWRRASRSVSRATRSSTFMARMAAFSSSRIATTSAIAFATSCPAARSRKPYACVSAWNFAPVRRGIGVQTRLVANLENYATRPRPTGIRRFSCHKICRESLNCRDVFRDNRFRSKWLLVTRLLGLVP